LISVALAAAGNCPQKQIDSIAYRVETYRGLQIVIVVTGSHHLEFLMRALIGVTILMAVSTLTANEGELLDQDFRRLAADEVVNLADTYEGKLVLVVNTASKCGNTPQYEGLEKLYEEYGDDGLVVLGFPSNDFMGQEPGTEEQIEEFCRLTYSVKFPMFEKVTVKEGEAHPFFDQLAAAAGTYPTWNFHKYLIGRDGQLISEFSPRTQPYSDDLIAAISTAISR
jgi:glutathione peroxidase